ncbi:MAG: ArsR family transcriptional regulator [Tistlia sp.]|uniref:VpaChn25_0724 family phage protein n=1 Tax=Tistlia sp. TaxID=3057121 RepID=UPI0034A3D7B9
MSLSDIKAEDRRREILRLLAADKHETASEDMIDRALDAMGMAFRASRAQVRTDLTWLSEQGLLKLEDLGGLILATLTQYGHDVASGDAVVPGVSRRPRGR